jgi:hypothetical protein
MEKSVKTKMAKRDVKELISEFSEYQILTPDEMICVRGGDGDGGSDGVLLPPPPG